ncbi:MAG: Rieske 2Fe-2S domain-containing protein [Chthoniobacter sp.]|uniref:QcrA and Rieske domain-containing protein n=1 Tax=Chthoniobacter sp. TaxID=2510640 RepID=UPI0032A65189
MNTPHESPNPLPETPPPASGDRREFLKSAACVALGGACVLVPLAAGVTVLLGPLRSAPPDGSWVNLTKIEALPIGAPPRLFQVFVERTDAWTRHGRSAVGAVFLERLDETTVRAFQSACPHLGCSVEWRKEKKHFFCPCHNSAFSHDGEISGPSPAARGLDALAVEIRDEGEVWVKFQTFKAGVKEKLPVA